MGEKMPTAGRPPAMAPGYRSTLIRTGDERFEEAERLEHDVFVASGYCDPSPLRRVREYDPWRDVSAFAAVEDIYGGRLVGSVRVMSGPYRDLPIGEFERDLDDSLDDPVCEYVATAVAPEARAQGVAEELWRSVWIHARRGGVAGLVGLVDPWLHERLNEYYGFTFRQLGRSRWYMGGEVRPIGTGLPELEANLLATRHELWSWLLEPWTNDELIDRGLPVDDRILAARSLGVVDLRSPAAGPTPVPEVAAEQQLGAPTSPVAAPVAGK